MRDSLLAFTSRRTTEKEGHLTVGDGLLGQIVVDDDGVLSVVTEPFFRWISVRFEVISAGIELTTHGGTGERRNVSIFWISACRDKDLNGEDLLKRSGLRGSGGNDNRVLHGVVLLKGLDELGDGRTLLTDGNVDAVKLLGLVVGVVPPLLVEDGVKSDGSLTGLTVTNDQLTLTTADGNHGVDGLETSLDGLADGLTGQNTGGLELSTAALSGLEGTLSIDGVTESVNDTSEKSLADGNVDNLSGTLDGLTLLDETVRTEKHNTDLAGFQVHAHALDTGGEPATR